MYALYLFKCKIIIIVHMAERNIHCCCLNMYPGVPHVYWVEVQANHVTLNFISFSSFCFVSFKLSSFNWRIAIFLLCSISAISRSLSVTWPWRHGPAVFRLVPETLYAVCCCLADSSDILGAISWIVMVVNVCEQKHLLLLWVSKWYYNIDIMVLSN